VCYIHLAVHNQLEKTMDDYKLMKLDDSDLFDLRLKGVRLLEAAANMHRVIAGEWPYLSPYQVKVLENVFNEAEELKQMLNVIKNRHITKDISTCFDEEAA
jgi:hypothetical protein